MESKFDQLMAEYGIIEEKNDPSLMNYSGTLTPGTEVKFKPSASSHPFIKSKGQEFQDKVKKYVSENKKKSKKYRLIVTAVNTIRPGMEYMSDTGGNLGFLATITENYGTHNTNSFTVPAEVLEVVNASWNQNSADVPDEWRQDMSRFNRFNEVIRGYFDRGGMQSKGIITNP